MCALDDSCNCKIWIIVRDLRRLLIQPAAQEGLTPSWIIYSGSCLAELWKCLWMEVSHHFRQLVPILNCCHGEEFAPKSSKCAPYCSLWLFFLVSLLCWEKLRSAFSIHPQYWNTVVRFPVSLFNAETQVPQLPFLCHVLHSCFHSRENLDLLHFATYIPVPRQPRWTQYIRDTLASAK